MNKEESLKFYVGGDPNRVIYLNEVWLRGEFVSWAADAQGRQPGRVLVKSFLDTFDLVPVDGTYVIERLTANTNDYNRFFSRARSLGVQMRMAGVPNTVIERAVTELKREAFG